MSMEISWTRKARRLPEEVREEISRRLNTLQPYFPELKPQVKIGLTRFLEGFVFQSNSGSVKLKLDVRKQKNGAWRYPTYWTIAHELMHLAQFNSHSIPGGERTCDIFALARLPPRFIDESPTYLFVPPDARATWRERDAELAHTLAELALRKLADGEASYASFWEDEFEHSYETA
ncbi:MAG: hypothetical protein OEM29_00290 [Thermoplasmata archaeon]|nr:hypothetical protein [Thermoplasmata archaeon]